MRAVMLEAPDDLLAERRRKGLDVYDELWDGVLHMPPPPSSRHQRLGTRLLVTLEPLARAVGIEAYYETGLYRPAAGERDYRVPDLAFARRDQVVARGLEGAELVIEILSPNDETYDKLPFYAELGVREVVVVDPETLAIEMFVVRGGKTHAALPDGGGVLRLSVLSVEVRTLPGPKLELIWASGRAEL